MCVVTTFKIIWSKKTNWIKLNKGFVSTNDSFNSQLVPEEPFVYQDKTGKTNNKH